MFRNKNVEATIPARAYTTHSVPTNDSYILNPRNLENINQLEIEHLRIMHYSHNIDFSELQLILSSNDVLHSQYNLYGREIIEKFSGDMKIPLVSEGSFKHFKGKTLDGLCDGDGEIVALLPITDPKQTGFHSAFDFYKNPILEKNRRLTTISNN